MDLVGASIGAWRMATACLDHCVAAFERLEHDYIRQDYALELGQSRPTADQVSESFARNLQAFYGQRVSEVLIHPRYRLHVVTARGRHLLRCEHRVRTPIDNLGAFLTNTVHRKAMGAWRAVVPGWLDKGLKWRHKPTRFLDNLLLLAPDPQWVARLPRGKLPDRNDFIRYGHDLPGRIRDWSAAASASVQLAEEFAGWVQAPDPHALQPL